MPERDSSTWINKMIGNDNTDYNTDEVIALKLYKILQSTTATHAWILVSPL